MRKVRCDDCGRRREPHRPVKRNADSSVAFVCRQCWRDREYGTFLRDAAEADAAALRAVLR